MEYYGTDLKNAGHYFFLISNNQLCYSNRRHGELPFSPDYLSVGDEKGTVRYVTIDCPQKDERFLIVSISGSCADHRGGTKSVFWKKTTDGNSVYDFANEVKGNEVFQKMESLMNFKIKW